MAEEETREDGYKLEVLGLSLELEGRRVLDGIDLGVREGETLVLLGPSGAGKSMLLRAVVRLTPITAGQVLLDGRHVEGLPPEELRRRVNLVPQDPAMLEGSVEENLRFGLDLAGIVDREVPDRIAVALEDAGLDEGFLDRRADRLSGGERRRVAIARAHALRPEVLILDEPTAALDPRTTRQVEEAIRRLKAAGRFTLVVVTHDVEQAKRLGDRTVLLRLGRVVAEGASATILDGLDPEEKGQYLGELERWREEARRAREGEACE
jgi:putative ABC transport system ATP-binding protein